MNQQKNTELNKIDDLLTRVASIETQLDKLDKKLAKAEIIETLTYKDIAKIMGLSYDAIVRRVSKRADFPKPINGITKRPRFLKSDILTYLQK